MRDDRLREDIKQMVSNYLLYATSDISKNQQQTTKQPYRRRPALPYRQKGLYTGLSKKRGQSNNPRIAKKLGEGKIQ
jgi:hypothetical protein